MAENRIIGVSGFTGKVNGELRAINFITAGVI
jgi:hypothetical protein